MNINSSRTSMRKSVPGAERRLVSPKYLCARDDQPSAVEVKAMYSDQWANCVLTQRSKKACSLPAPAYGGR